MPETYETLRSLTIIFVNFLRAAYSLHDVSELFPFPCSGDWLSFHLTGFRNFKLTRISVGLKVLLSGDFGGSSCPGECRDSILKQATTASFKILMYSIRVFGF